MTTTPKRRGRPRIGDIRATVTLPAALHAELVAESAARGIPLSEEIRRRCELVRPMTSRS